MKIISYNVNGIRSAMNKNFTGWLAKVKPDVICLQEIKANPGQFDNYMFEILGYHTYWYPAQKKGYSGVGLLSLQKPDAVTYGFGDARYDEEGRAIRADFGDISVLSLYLPSGSSGEERQGFKMEFLDFFFNYIQRLRLERPNLVISGDINICHQPIDIHDPIRNTKSSGFLPEEREWMSRFLGSGFVDSWRHINPNVVRYSWWSFRAGARKNNKGWRIDYHLVSSSLAPRITDAGILCDVEHSDHCPVVVELGE